jgi:hypothetical protein
MAVLQQQALHESELAQLQLKGMIVSGSVEMVAKRNQ